MAHGACSAYDALCQVGKMGDVSFHLQANGRVHAQARPFPGCGRGGKSARCGVGGGAVAHTVCGMRRNGGVAVRAVPLPSVGDRPGPCMPAVRGAVRQPRVHRMRMPDARRGRRGRRRRGARPGKPCRRHRLARRCAQLRYARVAPRPHGESLQGRRRASARRTYRAGHGSGSTSGVAPGAHFARLRRVCPLYPAGICPPRL